MFVAKPDIFQSSQSVRETVRQIWPSYHPVSSYSTVSLPRRCPTCDHPSHRRKTTIITTKSEPQLPAMKKGIGSVCGLKVAAETGKLMMQKPVQRKTRRFMNAGNGNVAQSKNRISYRRAFELPLSRRVPFQTWILLSSLMGCWSTGTGQDSARGSSSTSFPMDQQR